MQKALLSGVAALALIAGVSTVSSPAAARTYNGYANNTMSGATAQTSIQTDCLRLDGNGRRVFTCGQDRYARNGGAWGPKQKPNLTPVQ